MQIQSGIAILEITATIMGRTNTICPTVIWNEEQTILIDTGYPGQAVLIEQALQHEGLPLDRLTDILITHQDIDHIGSLSALRGGSNSSTVQVWASAIERPYIQGDKMLIKVTQAGIDQAVASLPQDMPETQKQAFRYALEHPPTGTVDQLIGYGENAHPFKGITVIDTPGHTPGHVSLYHAPSRTLIAADALTIIDGELALGQFNYDQAAAAKSLAQFAACDIGQVICYHGGLYRDADVNGRIRALIQTA
ncbi:glyoxylase-like metal-dependent hydrolase (beta-lactamase superfamily II) [Paenibacillus taihuensis]|uniref:Glyoxylase-like metal-dependent hydrolase (Beta-lactamase superfamily II) n=1 Tax=Paenibacillus taihuensis TaxID=1156355 RepID=A0A3D9SEJ9_9BACL|nr:MBL fold metallo-hydrolase [Paenibacillus taihuensis]REE94336.1 glyoxylase-like metal-dependent hydrolase (beta-lactamase superfamily II) [Paenibacillus taihuensis]